MTMSKVWLITGSGSGLGRAIAEAALKNGHQVVATARDTDQLSDLVAQFGRQVLAFRLDVTIEDEGKAAVRAAVETFRRLDVLVNNAGYDHRQEKFDVNYRARRPRRLLGLRHDAGARLLRARTRDPRARELRADGQQGHCQARAARRCRAADALEWEPVVRLWQGRLGARGM